MKTVLKQLLRSQTKQTACPYAAHSSALKRLWAIFRTANATRFKRQTFFSPPNNAQTMASIWQVFQPVAQHPNSIPHGRGAFDSWIERLIDQIARTYSATAPFPLGIAQKTANLFLKDLWAWDHLNPAQEACLHAPVDRLIVQRLKNAPKSWKSWSLVQWTTPTQLQTFWADYMVIQNSIRNRAAALSTPVLQMEPLMLEQIIWGRI